MPELSQSNRFGITGSTLKLIAIFTMLIDHIGAAVLFPYMQWKFPEVITALQGASPLAYFTLSPPSATYLTMRLIGRIAFPIFCFLLVEGFVHTRDVKRYALRLGVFALVSEIPFDLAFADRVLEFGYQNVYFTLLIGLVTIAAADRFAQDDLKRYLPLVIGAVTAQLLTTDYSAFGVIFIFLFYQYHGNDKLRNIVTGIACAWEVTAPLALIPIQLYNGERGWKLKYIFYAFYPGHLLLLYFIKKWLIS